MLRSTDFGAVLALITVNVCVQFAYYQVFTRLERARRPAEKWKRSMRELASQASKKLRTDTFAELSRGYETAAEHLSCCICLAEFKPTARATSLKCDHRHIFHEGCLRRALEVKLQCPICREPVDL